MQVRSKIVALSPPNSRAHLSPKIPNPTLLDSHSVEIPGLLGNSHQSSTKESLECTNFLDTEKKRWVWVKAVNSVTKKIHLLVFLLPCFLQFTRTLRAHAARTLNRTVTDRPCSCWHAGTCGNDRLGTGYVERRRPRTCRRPCTRTACYDVQIAWRSRGIRRSSQLRSASRKHGRRRLNSLQLLRSPLRLTLAVVDLEVLRWMTMMLLRTPSLPRAAAADSLRHRTDRDSGWTS